MAEAKKKTNGATVGKSAAAKAKSTAKPKAAAAKSGAKTANGAKTAKTKASARSKASGPAENATKGGIKVTTGRFPGARRAFDLPLETVRGAANRVGGLVSPVTDRVGGDSRVNALTSQVEAVLKQVEKQGSAVRADAGRRVTEIKDNEKLKVLGDRAEKVQVDLTRVLETQSARAQDLIGKARGQISALRR